ncbi:DUF4167 domain-containing protein [Labrys sp. LIt4]|uniref:DUF4167 domain-containing protein n=1 Tax=Labrys sp. LIt4 TaxID=2821355 RepID=UPI001AE04364|nr:DUF4167 domain-containing protein [Labrys sp. LIt4]MBP0582759.1 DUF4167 domain-containing protein [Labrys sp. LIt4]
MPTSSADQRHNEAILEWLRISMNTNYNHTKSTSGIRFQRPAPSSGAGHKNARNARENYESYLRRAHAEAAAGDLIAAENYYQHAEHYLRTMQAATQGRAN